ncbi:uncharacterized protein LOC106662657 [Cimex lectularius]|uniref:DNA/RNA non-specific endonuclease/pyrophosphatase/phosphodiesterase domain-containing protein n=1 Tax=Cimex lectularius TaxID=79782 RepID=A0A8I6TDW8_CIMLE|nr:uncharacterized protein LOC106662657 [Cimex lectularius]
MAFIKFIVGFESGSVLFLPLWTHLTKRTGTQNFTLPCNRMLKLLTFLGIFSFTSLGCLIDVQKLNRALHHKPLYLERTNDGLRLASPTSINWRVVLDFQTNHLILACPGTKNYLIYGEDVFGDRLEGVCFIGRSGRVTIQIMERMYNVYNFRCSHRLESFEVVPDRSNLCGFNDSFIYKTGYIVNDELFPLIESCHDEQTGRTHWSKHELLGISMSAMISNYKGPIITNNNVNLYTNMEIENAYRLRNQRDSLAKVLGKNKTKSLMKRNIDSFVKSQLAPPADFKLDTWKDVAYHFVNAEFQWQPINTGLWKSLENEIRQLAKILEQDFSIVTGASGQLEVIDEQGNMKPVSLGEKPNTLWVPRYFWKIIQNRDYECMGFIVINFQVDYLEERFVDGCSPCYLYGWRKLLGKEYAVQCCSYELLRSIVPEMPVLQCDDMLKFQNRLE